LRYFIILFGIAAVLSSCSSLKSVTRSGKSTHAGMKSDTERDATSVTSNQNHESLPLMPEKRNAPKIIFLTPVNIDLYHFIDNWWGTPYRMGGSTQKGVDCSAFTQTLISDIFGQQIPRTAQEQKDFCSTVDLNNLKEGDLIFFKTKKGRDITHVGIYLMDERFVHASSSNGVMISSLSEPYWSRHFAGAGRVVDEQITTAVR